VYGSTNIYDIPEHDIPVNVIPSQFFGFNVKGQSDSLTSLPLHCALLAKTGPILSLNECPRMAKDPICFHSNKLNGTHPAFVQ